MLRFPFFVPFVSFVSSWFIPYRGNGADAPGTGAVP